ARGRAGTRRPLPLPPDQGRLLRRRAPVLDDLAEGAADVSAASAARPHSPRRLRRALPAHKGLHGSRPDAVARLAATPVRRAGGRADVGAAARLEVRRPLRRPPGDVHLGAYARDVEDSRQVVGRGDGLARGWLPDADRRARAEDRRARRRDPRRPSGRADRRRERRGDRPPRRRRPSAIRLRPLHACAAGLLRASDSVSFTWAPQMSRRLLAPELLKRAPEDHCRYLGVVCLLLKTRRSISPYYHLNITDRRVPLTTIVETTHVVDPDAVGGHLLYVSKYVDPSSPLHERPVDEIEREFLGHARTIFPDLTDEDILASVVHRARVTEPVHTLGGAENMPEMFSIPNAALASTAHVYPEIVSGQAVTGVAER